MNDLMKNSLIAIAYSNASIQQELTGAVLYSQIKNSIKKFEEDYKAEYEAALFRVGSIFSITVDC